MRRSLRRGADVSSTLSDISFGRMHRGRIGNSRIEGWCCVRLKVGRRAPAFVAQDLSGRPVALADYRGKTLLLSFYRMAACPLCNVRTFLLINRYPTYQRRGVHMVAFFESSPAYAHRYLIRSRAPFPLVVDPMRTTYGLYGLETSWFVPANSRLFRGAVDREASRRP